LKEKDKEMKLTKEDKLGLIGVLFIAASCVISFVLFKYTLINIPPPVFGIVFLFFFIWFVNKTYDKNK